MDWIINVCIQRIVRDRAKREKKMGTHFHSDEWAYFRLKHHHIITRKWRHLANVVRSNWFNWKSVFICLWCVCPYALGFRIKMKKKNTTHKKKEQRDIRKNFNKTDNIYFVMKIAAMHIGYHNMMRALQCLLHFSNFIWEYLWLRIRFP